MARKSSTSKSTTLDLDVVVTETVPEVNVVLNEDVVSDIATDVVFEPSTDVVSEPVAVSSEPVEASSEPVAVSSEPVAVSSEPVAVSSEPVAEIDITNTIEESPSKVVEEPPTVFFNSKAFWTKYLKTDRYF